MDLNWFESLIYGLVSGLTNFLPVSSQAHEALMLKLFGAAGGPLIRLVVHAAVWEALYLALRGDIEQMLHARQLAKIPPRRRTRQPDQQRLLDFRLVQTAAVPMLLAFVLMPFVNGWNTDLSKIACFLLVNGLILYIPRHLRSANKDSRSMSGLDGVLMGLCGALAVLPGISRVGAVTAAASARGADKEHALRWSFLLELAAMLVLVVLDAVELYNVGISAVDTQLVIGCVLAAATAFGGAVLGIQTMRFLAVRTGFSGFAYYSWGVALFTFILYLTV